VSQDGSESFERRLGDRIQHELHVTNPLEREPAQHLRHHLRGSLHRRSGGRRLALLAAGAAPEPHQDGDRALHVTGFTPGSPAGRVDFGPQRRDACWPVAGLKEPGIPGVHIRDGDG